MNKETHIDLIWKKIDNELSKEESLRYDELFLNDPSFKALYNKTIRLNKTLSELPTHKAPVSLLDNIMQQVAIIKKYNSAEYNSFVGLKYIFIAVIAAILSLTAYVLAFHGASPTVVADSTPVADFFRSLSGNISVPSGLQNYLPYTLVLTIGLGLILLDNYFKSNLKTARAY